MLLFLLTYQHCKGNMEMKDKLPLMIIIFSIASGILSIIRVKMDILTVIDGDRIIRYVVLLALEQFCRFGSYWLFSFKYYETVSDLQNLMENDDNLRIKQSISI